MNERLVAYTFSVADPTEGSAVGALAVYFMVPFEATLVYASVAPFADDTGATMDINIGSGGVAAIDASDKDVPGEWAAKGYGGANTPVAIPAGTEVTLDFNAAAAANRFDAVILLLAGEKWD
jgi:hypothetical protein